MSLRRLALIGLSLAGCNGQAGSSVFSTRATLVLDGTRFESPDQPVSTEFYAVVAGDGAPCDEYAWLRSPGSSVSVGLRFDHDDVGAVSTIDVDDLSFIVWDDGQQAAYAGTVEVAALDARRIELALSDILACPHDDNSSPYEQPDLELCTSYTTGTLTIETGQDMGPACRIAYEAEDGSCVVDTTGPTVDCPE